MIRPTIIDPDEFFVMESADCGVRPEIGLEVRVKGMAWMRLVWTGTNFRFLNLAGALASGVYDTYPLSWNYVPDDNYVKVKDRYILKEDLERFISLGTADYLQVQEWCRKKMYGRPDRAINERTNLIHEFLRGFNRQDG